MSESPAPAGVFAPVARRVRSRVALRRGLRLLERTVWPVSIVLVLMMLWALRGGLSILIALWAAWLLWQAGGLLWAWWQRPGEFSALALWDAATGRREAFASAWWFEQRGETSPAALRHVEAQTQALQPALASLGRDLPLKPARRLLLPLVLVLCGSLISAVRAPKDESLIVDDAMASKAAESARELANIDLEKKKLAGLKEDEQKQVEDLKAKIDKTAAELVDAAGKDARKLLAELERRARDAEKLAEELAKAREDWASDKLVEQLRKHADTADLGDAVAGKNTQAAAKAAQKLADDLKSPQLPADAKQRMTNTLDDVRSNAEDKDRQRMVGQHVLGAADDMQKGDSKAAGAQFDQLADKMRDMSLREQAQNQLQQLAQQLRDAGSNITGQQPAGDMQQLGQNGQQSGQNGANQQQAPQVGQTSPNAAQQQQQMLAPPGLNQQQPNQMQPPGQQGQGQQQQQPMLGQQQQQPGGQNKQGQQQGQQGQPMLIAPVPGKPDKPDANSPTILMPGQQPDDGQGQSVAAAMPGGQTPGAGKADLNNTPTEKQGTQQQDVVQAQQNAEGQSSMRTVEGGTRAEQSGRGATQTTLQAIQAEEAALDEAALPPARREQVRRYFNELRKRFEPPAK